jgi:hypothetical protein
MIRMTYNELLAIYGPDDSQAIKATKFMELLGNPSVNKSVPAFVRDSGLPFCKRCSDRISTMEFEHNQKLCDDCRVALRIPDYKLSGLGGA